MRWPDRPVQQFAAAIGADIIQRLRTCRAESAFEGADEGTASRSREVSPAPFAVWPHLKHQAAASATAVQMRSTTSFTWSSRSPSAITRMTGSVRSEEHTSELQSLMRISYAVFCLKKKIKNTSPMTMTAWPIAENRYNKLI